MANLGSVKAKGDKYFRACLFPLDVGCQRSDEREVGCGFAGARDDEWVGEVEGVGSRNAGVERGGVRDELEGFLAKESIVAGFDG
jgi:hypothetical protein